MRLSARLQIHPRVRLPLNAQLRQLPSASPMSNNHYGLLRTNSEENLSNVPDYLSSICDDNSMASTSSSFYEFSDVTVLLKQIETLYLTDQLSDITIIVESERFPCHRVILACRSAYFRAMFFGGLREQQDAEVVLHDTPLEAFKVLLRYIYSGRIRFQSLKFEVILDIFVLAHKFGFSDLEQALCEYLKHVFHHSNVISIYSMACFYSLDDLLNASLDFIDRNAVEVLKTDAFLQLVGRSLYDIFKRDSFCVPEITIFNIVQKWIQQNPDEQESHRILLECVRLPLIKIEDLLGIVRPTNLVDADRILDTINEQTNKRNKFLNYRGTKLLNTNICTQQNARVIEGEYTEHLLRTDSMRVEIERCPRHALTENYKKGITIELGMAYIINYIELHLFDRDQRAYSYFVEVSTDQHDWIRVIDYTNYLCRSRQQLYFSQKVVKFIRIVGTFAKVNNSFYLTTIKAMFTNKPFNVDPDTTLLHPTQNIASIENGAIVVEGVSRSRNALINGNCEEYDWDVGYTCHQIGSGSITVQLPQPYLINSMRLLLWDCDDRSYSFDIDVSSDGQAWTQVVRAHELRSWQVMRFHTMPVVFIRIVGTFNTANEVFHLVHFECPSKIVPGFKSDQESVDEECEFPVIYGVQKLSLPNAASNEQEAAVVQQQPLLNKEPLDEDNE